MAESEELLPLFFNVSYNGQDFAGFQKQDNGESIASALEDKWRTVLGTDKIKIRGASRTDSGVHAIFQAACAFIPAEIHSKIVSQIKNFRPLKILYGLNALLRPSIKVLNLARVPKDFQVQFMAKGKSYVYCLYLDYTHDPFFPWSWCVGKDMNLTHLLDVLKVCQGEHDFRSFAKSVSARNKNCTRTIYPIKIIPKGRLVQILVRGNGFLHNQIRTLVGTAVQIAKRRDLELTEKLEFMQSILMAKDRKQAGFKAPATGLFLHRVYYPMEIQSQFIYLT